MSDLLPTEDRVKSMLSMLFGDTIEVSPSDHGLDQQPVKAEFAKDDGSVSFAIRCDYSFANFAGAALTKIPPAVAQEFADAKEIPNNIQENLNEVFNVCVSFFANTTTEHLQLAKISVEDDQQDCIVENIRFEVDLPNYGKGHLSLIAC